MLFLLGLSEPAPSVTFLGVYFLLGLTSALGVPSAAGASLGFLGVVFLFLVAGSVAGAAAPSDVGVEAVVVAVVVAESPVGAVVVVSVVVSVVVVSGVLCLGVVVFTRVCRFAGAFLGLAAFFTAFSSVPSVDLVASPSAGFVASSVDFVASSATLVASSVLSPLSSSTSSAFRFLELVGVGLGSGCAAAC